MPKTLEEVKAKIDAQEAYVEDKNENLCWIDRERLEAAIRALKWVVEDE